MHEEALIRDLLRKIEDVTRAHGARRVRSFTVWIGALSHLSEEQLRARFPLAAAGTLAEGASMEVQRSGTLEDPRAQGVVLVSVSVDTPEIGPGPPVPPTASRAAGP